MELQIALSQALATRANAVKLLDGLGADQLNQIPVGFGNNIIWNAAHIVATQQILCYSLAGLNPRIEQPYIDSFRKGTKARENYNIEVISKTKQLLSSSIDWLAEDLEEIDFSNFKEYTTSYNVTLKSIENAVNFNNIHEGLHLGYMMAQRKLV